ncbi:LAFA_0E09208g1_1 [Lachancea sp. 'fantastica']|nr:LAFA_0E09208g1_1 [Lachancea sp. 'fantastica']
MTDAETGMLDVGTHCKFCRQLDFLPFHCEYCKGDFCGAHRTRQQHQCETWNESEKQDQTLISSPLTQHDNGGQYFKSLLPEKAHVRVQQNSTNTGTGSDLGRNRSVRERLEMAGQTSALAKLKSFFQRRTTTTTTTLSSSSSLSSNGAKKPQGPAARLVELAKLKKSAVGDSQVPVGNRVYVYCYVVSDQETENQPRHQLFLNKMWPVGRALDSVASQLNVNNTNSHATSSSKEKLFLYREASSSVKNAVPALLEPSARVHTEIHDLDTLFLVRGHLEP